MTEETLKQKLGKPKDSETNKEKERIRFHCEVCGMEELCDYFGKDPPFVNRIKFLEDSYTMRDVFSPPPLSKNPSKAEYFFVLGAHCLKCNRIVCKSSECSFFYGRTYCLDCTMNNIKQFPIEIQTKIKKQIATNKN